MRRLLTAVLIAAVVTGGGPVASSLAESAPLTPSPVATAAASAPNVKCVRLDRAKKKLYRAGFNVRLRGGGLFGVVVDSGWVITSQNAKGRTVTVYVARSC
jgi:hypothetical protein